MSIARLFYTYIFMHSAVEKGIDSTGNKEFLNFCLSSTLKFY